MVYLTNIRKGNYNIGNMVLHRPSYLFPYTTHAYTFGIIDVPRHVFEEHQCSVSVAFSVLSITFTIYVSHFSFCFRLKSL